LWKGRTRLGRECLTSSVRHLTSLQGKKGATGTDYKKIFEKGTAPGRALKSREYKREKIGAKSPVMWLATGFLGRKKGDCIFCKIPSTAGEGEKERGGVWLATAPRGSKRSRKKKQGANGCDARGVTKG